MKKDHSGDWNIGQKRQKTSRNKATSKKERVGRLKWREIER